MDEKKEPEKVKEQDTLIQRESMPPKTEEEQIIQSKQFPELYPEECFKL
jgi:hypothetical protein